MKRFIIFFLTAVSMFALVSMMTGPKLDMYKNDEYGISIEVPKEWKSKELSRENMLLHLAEGEKCFLQIFVEPVYTKVENPTIIDLDPKMGPAMLAIAEKYIPNINCFGGDIVRMDGTRAMVLFGKVLTCEDSYVTNKVIYDNYYVPCRKNLVIIHYAYDENLMDEREIEKFEELRKLSIESFHYLGRK